MLAEVVRRASGATTTTWPIAISASEGRKPMKVKYMSAASPKASMGRISGDMKNVSSARTHVPDRRARGTQAGAARAAAPTIPPPPASGLVGGARGGWGEGTGADKSRGHRGGKPGGGDASERPRGEG